MDGPNRLEELVNTYETTLYRAALAILGDAHEAEDAVQDAFLRCLEKAPDFESPAHARAWLLRGTVNGCKSRLRAPWRRRTAPLLDAYPAAAPEEGTVYTGCAQHSLAPAGIASSTITRWSFSSPCSVWTAESSMPQLSCPIILRGGRLIMATRVLPTSSSGL